MGRRAIQWPEEKIALRIRQGFGQGTGQSYKGWFTARDLSSKGITTRFPCGPLGRGMLFLSNIEKNAFLGAAYLRSFVDYWEQWPMERRETLDIARSLGVRHPTYFGTNRPIVMTLDGVLTLREATGTTREVLDSKPRWLASNPRTAEKLAIHVEYARRRGWPYRRFSEHSVPQVIVFNLEWMLMGEVKKGEIRQVRDGVEAWAVRMHRTMLRQEPDFAQARTVRGFCTAFDERNAIPSGCGLRCLKLLLLQRRVDFDIEKSHLELLRGPVTALKVNRVNATAYAYASAEIRVG